MTIFGRIGKILHIDLGSGWFEIKALKLYAVAETTDREP